MPMVDLDTCIHCCLCERTCPVRKLDDSHNTLMPLKVIAAKNLNREIAAVSSSGGIFSVFAEYILKKDGVVYGVALSKELKAIHIRVNNINSLSKIRGSKYLHSNAAKAYSSVKEDLKAKKNVLFSGTPCQIAALKQFLRKDYSNLLCIEVVCHGVPTDRAFNKYIEYLQSRHKSRVTSVNFRDKSKGWNDNCISFTFENGKKFLQRGADNLYTQGYVNNLFVRDCCTACQFKNMKSGADITLGDMWGIESLLPTYPKDCGVSMVCINSLVGENAFRNIELELSDCIEVSYESVKKYNECIWRSVRSHEKRIFFLQNCNEEYFDRLIKESLNINVITITKRKIKKVRKTVISSIIKIKHLYLH